MKFSIIIPLFNKAPYVAKAIQSVLAQTFTDYELVIFDDGSRDDSASIAARAIEGRTDCRLVKQENAGVSVARNNGVAVSRGDFLCFLDADDWWDPNFLAEMDKLIEEYPDAGIYGTNYTIVNETKRMTRVANVGVEDGFEKGYINYCRVYAKTLVMPLWTGAVCIPKNVFGTTNGFPKNVKLGEDFILWVQIALKHKVAFLNKPLSFYNQDVDVANRGVGRLHEPQHHMLWNLGFLAEEEKANPDYKQLVDNLRVSAMLRYYITKEYHDVAKTELDKVDWSRQPKKAMMQYQRPVAWLRLWCGLMKAGAMAKQLFRRLKYRLIG